jgi:hypothetical protein
MQNFTGEQETEELRVSPSFCEIQPPAVPYLATFVGVIPRNIEIFEVAAFFGRVLAKS